MLIVTIRQPYTNQNGEVLCILASFADQALRRSHDHCDELREKKQLYYDDVSVGQQMPPLVIGPLTPTHLFRWSAAIENWHRIHYDQSFAIYHEGLPSILGQGSWKQSISAALSQGPLPAGRLAVESEIPASRDDRAGRHDHGMGHSYEEVRRGRTGLVELDVGMRLPSKTRDLSGKGDDRAADQGRQRDPLPVRSAEGERLKRKEHATLDCNWTRAGLGRSRALHEKMKGTPNWRVDPKTTITTVFALADGRIMAECHARPQADFDEWLKKRGWKVESVAQIRHVAKTGEIWKIS